MSVEQELLEHWRHIHANLRVLCYQKCSLLLRLDNPPLRAGDQPSKRGYHLRGARARRQAVSFWIASTKVVLLNSGCSSRWPFENQSRSGPVEVPRPRCLVESVMTTQIPLLTELRSWPLLLSSPTFLISLARTFKAFCEALLILLRTTSLEPGPFQVQDLPISILTPGLSLKRLLKVCEAIFMCKPYTGSWLLFLERCMRRIKRTFALQTLSAHQRRLAERSQPWIPPTHPVALLDFPDFSFPAVPSLSLFCSSSAYFFSLHSAFSHPYSLP
jgi:hypothetical protein